MALVATSILSGSVPGGDVLSRLLGVELTQPVLVAVDCSAAISRFDGPQASSPAFAQLQRVCWSKASPISGCGWLPFA